MNENEVLENQEVEIVEGEVLDNQETNELSKESGLSSLAWMGLGALAVAIGTVGVNKVIKPGIKTLKDKLTKRKVQDDKVEPDAIDVDVVEDNVEEVNQE